MKEVVLQIVEALGWLRDTASRFAARTDQGPIDTVGRLQDFVATRAALVAQKKLYGYLKERMGVSFPKMFEDEVYARSIKVATLQVFAAALADVCIHAVAHATAGASLPSEERKALAMHCYREGVAANANAIGDQSIAQSWIADFAERASAVSWKNVAAGADAFTESPKALIRWAPIADEHKKYDRDIVENSIRFAWNEVRQELRQRLDGHAVIADWEGRPPEAPA